MASVETLQELVDAWDAGETIQLVSMGGLSDEYEMAIQRAVIHILKELIANPPPAHNGQPTALPVALHKAGRLAATAQQYSYGMYGAQVGAAQNAAGMIYQHGYIGALDRAPIDRIIDVSKDGLA